jgi:hypothetical protein
MSSLATKKSNTKFLAILALTTVALCVAVVVYVKGGFQSAPVVDLGPVPSFDGTAPMDPGMVGSVDPAVITPPPAVAVASPAPAAPANTLVAPASSPPAAAVSKASPASPTTISPEASDDLVSMMDLKRRSDLGRARIEALRTDIEAQQVEEQLNGAAIGANQLPELVGLSGRSPSITAEFLVGTRLLQARRGDWVTREWQLTDVLANGVTMTRRGGREQRNIIFGDGPQRTGVAAGY